MNFTDQQLELFDQAEDLRMRQRSEPLDGHPQEWHARHYIVKFTTVLGKEFFLWNPGAPVTFTEDRAGAYRYSHSEMGRITRDSDMREVMLHVDEVGVDGRVTFETIN